MAKNPNIIPVGTSFDVVGTLNQNFQAIQEGFENTLSRDGSLPNNMLADLDMDSNDILNVGSIAAEDYILNGVSLNEAIETVGAVAGPLQGGLTGQILKKNSNANYDYKWDTADGVGDMLESVYDPTSKRADAFDMDNMVDGIEKVAMTTGERAQLQIVAASIAQRKFSELTMGVEAADEIYPNARKATQGYTTIEVAGVRYQFVTGSGQDSPERKRIVQFPWADDEGALSHIAYSDLLNIGHGQDLSAVFEGGEIYLYSQTESGLGYTRTRWRGAATSQADVQTYEVLDGAYYSGATVAVSKDGKWLAFGCGLQRANYADNGHVIVLYDKLELDGAADKTKVSPVSVFPITKPRTAYANFLQGLAISPDGSMIATTHGYTTPLFRNWVSIWSRNGSLLRTTPVDGPRAEAGFSGIYEGTYSGVPTKFEPEGLDWLDNQTLLFQTIEIWRAPSSVVTYQGFNYAATKEGETSFSGVSPIDGTYWVRTDLPANAGAYNPSTTYTTGAYTRRIKTIHGVVVDDGNVRNKPLDAGLCMAESMSPIYSSFNNVDLSWPRSDWNAAVWDQNLGQFMRAFGYYGQRGWRVYDAREDGDNTEYFSITTNSLGSVHELRTKSGVLDNGYGENWYHADGGTSPHGKREYAGGELRRDLKGSGENFFSSTGAVVINVTRDGAGYLTRWYVGADVTGIAAGYATHFVIGSGGTKNLTITAGLDSEEAKEWRIYQSSGELSPSGLYNLGSASRRLDQIFATNGTINTSDAREKEQVSELSAAEKRVAVAAKGLLRKFKMSEAVAAKGDGARWHFGIIAQDLKAAFETEGLDPYDYGVLCYDEWPEQAEITEDGVVTQEYRVAGNRYGVRYEELMAFVLAAL